MLLCMKLLLVLFGLYNQLPPVYAGDGELISRDSRCFEPLFFSVVPAGTVEIHGYFIPRSSE